MPSACNSPSASRSEVRLTFNCSHNSRSTRRAPGSSTPVSMARRSDSMMRLRSETCGSCSAVRRPAPPFAALFSRTALSTNEPRRVTISSSMIVFAKPVRVFPHHALFIGHRLAEMYERAARHDQNEIGAIFARADQVFEHCARINFAMRHGRRTEIFHQRLFKIAQPEHAARSGSGHRRAHHRTEFSNEHGGDRIARCGAAELGVARPIGNGKIDAGDDLARLERGLIERDKEIVGGNAAAVGDDSRAETEYGGGVVRSRVVIGDRAADGAAMAHMPVTDGADHSGSAGMALRTTGEAA